MQAFVHQNASLYPLGRDGGGGARMRGASRRGRGRPGQRSTTTTRATCGAGSPAAVGRPGTSFPAGGAHTRLGVRCAALPMALPPDRTAGLGHALARIPTASARRPFGEARRPNKSAGPRRARPAGDTFTEESCPNHGGHRADGLLVALPVSCSS